MNAQQPVDLHIHTDASDGLLPPAQIVAALKKAGIKTFSITDHDSVASLDEANRRANIHGMRLITGVELSAEYQALDLHFLGYFINHHNKRFLDYLYLFRRRRYQRAQEMVKKLSTLGVEITMEQVVSQMRNGPVGRPHIADALIESRTVASRDEAFERFLGENSPVYVDKFRITTPEVIELIHSIGGAAFLAHPALSCPDETIGELINFGLDGIEVVHPSHDSEKVLHYTRLADDLDLITCGGSDFHGAPEEEEMFGTYVVYESTVDRIEQYCIDNRSEWITDEELLKKESNQADDENANSDNENEDSEGDDDIDE